MATTNTLAVQSRIGKEAFYQFKKRGEVTRNLTSKSSDFRASDNTGASYQYRRPARLKIEEKNIGDMNVDINVAPTYQGMNDALKTLTITKKFYVDVAQGIDSATLQASPDQIKTRFVTEAAARLRRKMDSWAAAAIISQVGNVIGDPNAAATGDTLLQNHAAAQSLLNNRGRSIDEDSAMICSEAAAQNLMSANLKNFFYEKEVEKLYKTGRMGTYAGFDYYRTPLLPSAVVEGNSAITLTLAAAGGAGTLGLATGYAETTTINLASSGAGTLKAGSKITIEGCYWIQPDTGATIGSGFKNTNADLTGLAVFSVVSDVVFAAAETKAVTVVEPIIYGGPYQNVNGPLVVNLGGDGTAVTVVSSASTNAYSLAFDRSAIFIASPRLDFAGVGVDYLDQQDIDGIDVTFMCNHDINGHRVWSLQAMLGLTVYLPELVTLVY